LFYQKHGTTTPNPTVFADSAHLASLQVMITLSGQSATAFLGDTTGAYYSVNHLSIPPGVNTHYPFGFHPFNPWPDALILDADEITTAKTATEAYNSSISAIAAAKGFALVDINTVFTNIFLASITHGGVMYNGVNFSAFFITGGLFSLDGFHPTSQGQGLIANEFLNVINSRYGSTFPLVNISTIPGSLNFGKRVSSKNFSFEVYNWKNFGL
jgi:lysophospholipase L1-like esterase